MEPLDRRQGAAGTGGRRAEGRDEEALAGQRHEEARGKEELAPEAHAQEAIGGEDEIREADEEELSIGARFAEDASLQRRDGRELPVEVSIMEREAPTVPETSSQVDLKLAVIGALSGIVAAMAMDAFTRCARAVHGGGREAPGATPGSERDNKGAQAPQAVTSSDEDATVKVGTAAFRTVAGYTPSRETQQWLGAAAHYAFSAAVGVNYLLASEQAPDLRRGYGTVYGSLVWATADEAVLPAAGLSKKPGEIPLGVHAYALAAHWVYGATLEACRRAAAALMNAWERPDAATPHPVDVATASPAGSAATVARGPW